MANGGTFVNIGDLAKPATALVEKISDAIGGLSAPWQIKRIAEAEAQADIIHVKAAIEIADIQRRAAVRWFNEEAMRQENMESITAQALPLLTDASKPQEIEDDWIVDFFDKCRLVSGTEMQALWAKVLAGEANAPGLFSKRTIAILSSMDSRDAQGFRDVCRSLWTLDNNLVPFIENFEDAVYTNAGITFEVLSHLEDIGLLRMEPTSGFRVILGVGPIDLRYFGRRLITNFEMPENKALPLGRVQLSRAGKELSAICEAEPSKELYLRGVQGWEAKFRVLTYSDSILVTPSDWESPD